MPGLAPLTLSSLNRFPLHTSLAGALLGLLLWPWLGTALAIPTLIVLTGLGLTAGLMARFRSAHAVRHGRVSLWLASSWLIGMSMAASTAISLVQGRPDRDTLLGLATLVVLLSWLGISLWWEQRQIARIRAAGRLPQALAHYADLEQGVLLPEMVVPPFRPRRRLAQLAVVSTLGLLTPLMLASGPYDALVQPLLAGTILWGMTAYLLVRHLGPALVRYRALHDWERTEQRTLVSPYAERLAQLRQGLAEPPLKPKRPPPKPRKRRQRRR